MSGASAGLVEHTARFCRVLRAEGLMVTPGSTLDAMRVLDLVDVGDREDLRLGLRSVLVTRLEDSPTFEEVFDAFWGGGRRPSRNPAVIPPEPPASTEERGARTLARWMRGEGELAEESVQVPGPSAQEALGTQDFATFGDETLRAVTALARRIARRLAAKPGRRWKEAARGSRISLRRMLREALRTGGEMSTLAFRERKPRRTKVVVLADVSGSMDLYARLLLQFLYALQNAFSRVETFVFATRLSRVTEHLRAPHYQLALGELSARVQDWNGGTRIGESLATFLQDWPRLLDRRTVAVVLSDGWETGDPEVLGNALATIHRRARRVVWLNPLLGTPGYEPLTRGMQAALPHIDVFAPANDLESLAQLAQYLAH
jgi:uncharacterized protein with von Willebrand factor type A (vWA) domain